MHGRVARESTAAGLDTLAEFPGKVRDVARVFFKMVMRIVIAAAVANPQGSTQTSVQEELRGMKQGARKPQYRRNSEP